MSDLSEKKSPEISVFVPSYNHAPFIGKCLESIANQTLKPNQLLVIDDGSKDNSPQIIEKFLKDCPFKTELIVRKNRGLCATLNEGFAKTSGEYFAYIGSDDYWLPTFLEERAKLLSKRQSAVLGYGHAFLINDKDEIFDSTANYTDSWANYPDGKASGMLLQGIAPISSTIFYRRSFLEKVSWNEDSRLEDYEMYLKLMNFGDFAFDPQVLSVWRQHGYNTSKNISLMLDEVIGAQNRNIKDLGISQDELIKIQTKTKFRYAQDFLQHGDKQRAFQLAKESWRGASSTFQLAKFALRMFVPMSLINFRRSLRNKS